MEVGSVSVKITGDSSDLKDTIKNALGELGKLSSAVGDVSQRMGRTAGGLYALGKSSKAVASGLGEIAESINKLNESSTSKIIGKMEKLKSAAEQTSQSTAGMRGLVASSLSAASGINKISEAGSSVSSVSKKVKTLSSDLSTLEKDAKSAAGALQLGLFGGATPVSVPAPVQPSLPFPPALSQPSLPPPPPPTGWMAYANSIEQAGRRMEDLRNTNRGLIDGLRSTGMAAMATGAALSAPAVKALADYKEFERELNSVSYILSKGMDVDDTGKRVFAELTKVAGETKFSIMELMASTKKLGQAGYDEATALKSTAAAAKLSTISSEDLVTSTDDLTNIMSQFKIGASGANGAVDTLAGVAMNANTNVRQLAEAIKNSGSVAEVAGVELDDLSIALGLLSNAGVKGAEAGTAVKLMMSYLIKGSKNAKKAQEELGLSMDDLSNGGLRGLLKGLEDFQEKAKETGQESQILKSVLEGFNTKAGPKLLALLGQGTAKYDDMAKSIRQLKDQKIFDKQVEADMKTLGGRINALQANINATSIEFGKFLETPVKGLISDVNSIVKAFNAMPDPIKQAAFAVGGLVSAIGLLAFTAGGISLAIGSILPAVLALGAAKGATSLAETFVILRAEAASALFFLRGQYPRTLAALTTSFKVLGTAIKWAFKELMIVVAAFYTFKTAVKGAEAVADMFGVSLSKSGDVWGDFVKEIEESTSSLGSFFAKLYSLSALFWQQMEIMTSYAQQYSELREEMGGFAGLKLLNPEVRAQFDIELANRMEDRIKDITDRWEGDVAKSAQFIKDQIDGIGEALSDISDKEKDVGKGMADIDFSKMAGDLARVIDSLEKMRQLVGDLGRQLEKMSIGPALQPLVEIKHTLEGDFQALSDALKDAKDAYAETVKSIRENEKLSGEEKAAGIARAGGALGQAQELEAIGRATALEIMLESLAKAMAEVPAYAFGDAVKYMKEILREYGMSISDIAPKLSNVIDNAISTITRETDKLRLGTLASMISSEFGGLVEELANARIEANKLAKIGEIGGTDQGQKGAEAMLASSDKASAVIEARLLPAIYALQTQAYETALGLDGFEKTIYDTNKAIKSNEQAAILLSKAFPQLSGKINQLFEKLNSAQRSAAAQQMVQSFNAASMGAYEFSIENEKVRKHLATLGEEGRIAATNLSKMPKIDTLGNALQGWVGKAFDAILDGLGMDAGQDVKVQAVKDISDSLASAVTGSFDAGKFGMAIFNVGMEASQGFRDSILSVLGFQVPTVQPEKPVVDQEKQGLQKATEALEKYIASSSGLVSSSNLVANVFDYVSLAGVELATSFEEASAGIAKSGEETFKRHLKRIGLMSDHRQKILSDPRFKDISSAIENSLKDIISEPAISKEAQDAVSKTSLPAQVSQGPAPGHQAIPGPAGAMFQMIHQSMTAAVPGIEDLADSAIDAADATGEMSDAAKEARDVLFDELMSGLDGIGEQAVSMDVAEVAGADQAVAGAATAAAGGGGGLMAGLSSTIGTLVAVVSSVVAALAALGGPIAALVVAATALVVAQLLLLSGAYIIGDQFWELSKKTESYQRFQAALEAATDRVVQALEPFWDNLMALAGLFSYTLDVLLPLAAGFANTEAISRILFEAFKMGAVIVAAAMIGIGHFASMVIAVTVSVLRAIAVFVNAIYSAPSLLVDAMRGLGAILYNAIGGVIDVIANWEVHLSNIWNGAMAGIAEALAKFVKAIVSIGPKMENIGRELLAGLANSFANIIDGVMNLPAHLDKAWKTLDLMITNVLISGMEAMKLDVALPDEYQDLLDKSAELQSDINSINTAAAHSLSGFVDDIRDWAAGQLAGKKMETGTNEFSTWLFHQRDAFEESINNFIEGTEAGDNWRAAAQALLDDMEGLSESDLGSFLNTLAGGIEDLSPDLQQMHENFNALLDLDYDEAKERGNFLADLKDTNDEFGEELTNVPQGFKVAAARFRAIAAESMGPGGPGRVAGDGNDLPTGTPGNNFYIEMLNVNSDRPMDLSEELEQEARRRTLGAGGAVPYNDGLNNGSGG